MPAHALGVLDGVPVGVAQLHLSFEAAIPRWGVHRDPGREQFPVKSVEVVRAQLNCTRLRNRVSPSSGFRAARRPTSNRPTVPDPRRSKAN